MFIRSKIVLIFTVLMLVVGVMVSPVVSLGIEKQEEVSKNFKDYNTVLFNNHTAHTADIEGSVAVSGDIITHGGFTYAGAYSDAFNIIGQGSLHKNTPGLVLGGQLKTNTADLIIIQGGNFVHGENFTSNPKLNISEKDTKILPWSNQDVSQLFSKFKTEINQEIARYTSFLTSQSEENLYKKQEAWVSTFNFYVSEKNKHVLFVDASNENLTLKDIYLPDLTNFDHVIIYSSQPKISFSKGSIVLDNKVIDTGKPDNPDLFSLASKLTWVLPNANEVSIEGYGVIGDMYAPLASVDTQGGSLNGSLYANNLVSKGGFEVHNFRNTILATTPGTGESGSESSTTTTSSESNNTETTTSSSGSTGETSSTVEPSFGEFRATKSVDKKTAKLGDILTYTITAENITPNSLIAKGSISDDLPTGLSLIKDSIEASVNGQKIILDATNFEINGNKVTVMFNNLKDNQKYSLSLQAKVTSEEAGLIKNVALVKDGNPNGQISSVEPMEEVYVEEEPITSESTSSESSSSSTSESTSIESSNSSTSESASIESSNSSTSESTSIESSNSSTSESTSGESSSSSTSESTSSESSSSSTSESTSSESSSSSTSESTSIESSNSSTSESTSIESSNSSTSESASIESSNSSTSESTSIESSNSSTSESTSSESNNSGTTNGVINNTNTSSNVINKKKQSTHQQNKNKTSLLPQTGEELFSTLFIVEGVLIVLTTSCLFMIRKQKKNKE